MSRLAWITIFPIYTSCVAGMTGMNYHSSFLLFEMRSLKLFAQTALQPKSS
jgi:hypothetical protein